ncbi:MAG: FAD-binding protein [Pyrinomonadaceae bacterium]|nr:FAD-binding protein [Pyrinomonadaceae bacterium]
MNIKGKIIYKDEQGFDEALTSTLFNKVAIDRKPDLIVYPNCVEDIIETIKFAKSIDKKISICSGGHSWSANHIRNNSFLINMSNFNTYEIKKDAMTATAGPAVGGSILLEAALRFLGFGAADSVSWGSMLNEAQGANLTCWWLILPSGLVTGFTVLSLYQVGEALSEKKE